MELRPLSDRVMIQTVPPPKMIGSIHVPDKAQRTNAAEGIVKAIGPGILKSDGSRGAMSVAVGDRVFFEPQPQSEVQSMMSKDGERVVVIGDGDVLAVIEP